jgi:hypothetical protein
MLKPMLAGAIMLNAWAIAVFFVRFWKKTHDPLFAWFAIAFVLLGAERISMSVFAGEVQFHVYLVRLAAFLLIIFAIWQKNRRSGRA